MGGRPDGVGTWLFIPVSTGGIDMAVAGVESMEDH